ncbi:MAG: hypothetical protein JHC57_15760 [Sphingopyxis sp.]|uniref:hypothetical protein n=1 Tax=Sphingopyxis sp. TaxID=1908224 RepID=UPI001A1DB55F|nr:hypothetical protein [Sphingopyxis sp.]MBJ7501211.1 hypothetical protein [Sphingopyxis sp.]
MAIECTAYRDDKGGLHSTPEKATLADLAGVLGRVGEEGGMTAGVAKLLFDKREEIERVFAEHDRMIEAADAASESSGDVIPIKEAK